MKKTNFFILASLSLLFFACTGKNTDDDITEKKDDTQISESVDNSGWEILFDGNSLNGWHNYLSDSINGWYIENGILITDGGNSDIVTDKEYENFELELEWSISDKGNSGIFFYVIEDEKYPVTYATAPEYQIIDDENYPQELTPLRHTAANFDLYAADSTNINPPGSFNHTKIVVDQGKVEHWLNGTKVLTYEIGSDNWNEIVENSKFANMEGFAAVLKGKIGLQDHGDKVSFRNIKIKEL